MSHPVRGPARHDLRVPAFLAVEWLPALAHDYVAVDVYPAQFRDKVLLVESKVQDDALFFRLNHLHSHHGITG